MRKIIVGAFVTLDGVMQSPGALIPFAPQPWSQGFGMALDRFGVTWIIDSPAV